MHDEYTVGGNKNECSVYIVKEDFHFAWRSLVLIAICATYVCAQERERESNVISLEK